MKNTFLFFILLVTLPVFSQTIVFEGIVQDANNTPLEMANVMAMNATAKTMDAYAITNSKGKFSLNLKPNATYTVKLSYLGMKNKEITVVTQTKNINQNITLEDGGIELEGVEVVREMPVSIKGDTIVYNADSFKSGTERKLEDILKKLPGVVVNADGEVEVEGKKVSKLMVEGKDFFDGDTKLGVKNIPADAIDKVQVLRNYNENSILKGVENNQDNVAMNIKLKEGKKNFWFGDFTAGLGVAREDERHVVNPKLFYYSPKYSLNLISNFNNIGELPLTAQDYFKFTGGFRNMMAKGGSSFNVSSNDLGISLIRNNRAKEIDTQFGAANFSFNPTKAWNLSGFWILSGSTTDTETATRTDFLEPNSQEVASTERKLDMARQKNNLGLFKLSSSYKPNADFQLDYDVLSKLSKQNEDSSFLRESVVKQEPTTIEDIYTNKKQNPFSVNQNLGLYYTVNEKNIFAAEIQHLYQDEDPFYNANLKFQPFDLSGYVSGQNRNDINQSRFVKTNKIDAKMDYYYMITPKSNINVTLGNTNSHQNFNSSIYQVLYNDDVNNLDEPENSNDVEYDFNDVFLGLHYKVLSGKFTFTPGASLHSYAMKNQQLSTTYKQNFTRLLPDFYLLYQIKKAESLTYNFAYTNNFTDINKLAEGYVLNSYNSLFKGNRTLENSISQTHSLRYFKYNMFNFENISANASYSRVVDAVKSRFVQDGVNQASTPINSGFADETFSAGGNYGRSFMRYYKANVRANVNWSKFNNVQVDPENGNAIAITNENFTQSYTLSASTNYKKLPNIELGYNWVVNNYKGDVFYTDKPFVRLDYYFLDSFSFVSEYEFYHYYNRNNTINNEYDFLSASLIYQKTKASHWEYKLSGTNLLNTTSLNDNSFNQYAISNSQYRVQPRYVILSLKYNL